jgi:hypothetical protein
MIIRCRSFRFLTNALLFLNEGQASTKCYLYSLYFKLNTSRYKVFVVVVLEKTTRKEKKKMLISDWRERDRERKRDREKLIGRKNIKG